MIIINADDWGHPCTETDAALCCYENERISSVSAMVFMEDSERAADLVKDIDIDVGLHLNLSQNFKGENQNTLLDEYQGRIVRFLTFNKYSLLIYNPFLRKQFHYSYQSQIEEFFRLYKRLPSHIDGHNHMHLCTNMLLDKVIPKHEKIRRSFSFWPGEKTPLNRMYRRIVDRWLAGRYCVTEYFFDLSQVLQHNRLKRVCELSEITTIELMIHPANKKEYTFLMSDEYLEMLSKLEKGTYSSL